MSSGERPSLAGIVLVTVVIVGAVPVGTTTVVAQGSGADCDVRRYAVYATDEDPANVTAELPASAVGHYADQSADARAVFDRARAREGEFVVLNDSERVAARSLPNVVVVNATGTVYRTQREARQCGGAGPGLPSPPVLAGLGAVALALVAAVVSGTVLRDGDADER